MVSPACFMMDQWVHYCYDLYRPLTSVQPLMSLGPFNLPNWAANNFHSYNFLNLILSFMVARLGERFRELIFRTWIWF